MTLWARKKGSNLLQKNGKTLEGDFITRQQPWTCTEKFTGPSGGHYGPPGPSQDPKTSDINESHQQNVYFLEGS